MSPDAFEAALAEELVKLHRRLLIEYRRSSKALQLQQQARPDEASQPEQESNRITVGSVRQTQEEPPMLRPTEGDVSVLGLAFGAWSSGDEVLTDEQRFTATEAPTDDEDKVDRIIERLESVSETDSEAGSTLVGKAAACNFGDIQERGATAEPVPAGSARPLLQRQASASAPPAATTTTVASAAAAKAEVAAAQGSTESVRAFRRKISFSQSRLKGGESNDPTDTPGSNIPSAGSSVRGRWRKPSLQHLRDHLASEFPGDNRRPSMASLSTGADKLSLCSPRHSSQGFDVLPVWRRSVMANSRRSRINYCNYNLIRRNSTIAGVLQEEEQDEEGGLIKLGDFKLLGYFMILPSALPRLCWDFFAMLLILYDCLVIPFMVSFGSKMPPSQVMIWIARMFWTLNVPISLLTGYLKKDGTVEMRPCEVAKHYSQTWLLPDISVVIMDWVEVMLEHDNSWMRLGYTLRLVRLVRVVRLLRFIKGPQVMDIFNEYIRSEQVLLFAAVIKIMFFIIGIAHWIACLWYFVGKYSHVRVNWIASQQIEELDPFRQYLHCFHWSLAQFAGELIIVPENKLERIFTIAVALLAIILYAYFTSSITTSMTRLQLISGKQSAQLASLRRFLLDRNISRPLATRVQQNAQYALMEQNKDVPEASVDLLALISNPLLVEVHFEIYSHVLLEHPFFQCYNHINPGGVMKVCHMAVMLFTMYQGDLLFSDFESSSKRMYFIVNGGLQYSQTRHLDVSATKSQWLCEAFLWTHWSHCGTARASTTSRLLALDAEKFQNIISTFPTSHAQHYAELFVSTLNDFDIDELTDLEMLKDEIDDLIEEAFPCEEEESGAEEEDAAQPQEDQGLEESDVDGGNPDNRQSDISLDGLEGGLFQERRHSSSQQSSVRRSWEHEKGTLRSKIMSSPSNASTAALRRLSGSQRHSRASLVAKKLSRLSRKGTMEKDTNSTRWAKCWELLAKACRWLLAARCCRLCHWSECARWVHERFQRVRALRVAGSSVQPFQAAMPDGA